MRRTAVSVLGLQVTVVLEHYTFSKVKVCIQLPFDSVKVMW